MEIGVPGLSTSNRIRSRLLPYIYLSQKSIEIPDAECLECYKAETTIALHCGNAVAQSP